MFPMSLKKHRPKKQSTSSSSALFQSMHLEPRLPSLALFRIVLVLARHCLDHGQIFAPGSDVANLLDSFVRGDGALPVTTGPIRGLPRAWRRRFGKGPETRPSLLFLDLPDPSTLDSESKNLAARSILELVKENNRHHIPVFGVSGCGKTRAVIELLSQHWRFYFNASNGDWGSTDMLTLHSTVQKHLNDTRDSPTVDR
ncbi:MAG: hypothetical protein J3R72DRAFT_501857 [Linnemannia gamsii]|nr:MAG: hypothetical protein J3R72DRAFT_501857 [Linnemannia gamsii]